jgi:RsmE family RNA methyltransferase
VCSLWLGVSAALDSILPGDVNLLLLEPAEIRPDGTSVVSASRARHLRDVLRVQPGHEVRAGVVDGGIGNCTVLALDAYAVTLKCTFEETPARPSVDLLLALPRPKVMRRLWSQVAALGVGRIILTNAARVERNYFDTHVLDPDNYRPLLLEGLQQARDTHLPVVSIHRRLKVLLEDDLDVLCPTGSRLVAQPGSRETFTTALGTTPSRERGERRTLLAVGPEGGWTDFELDLLATHGFAAVGMGGRTLRSDTACVALLALLHEALR